MESENKVKETVKPKPKPVLSQYEKQLKVIPELQELKMLTTLAKHSNFKKRKHRK